MAAIKGELLDTISNLIDSLDDEANRLGCRYCVRSDWAPIGGGEVGVGRWKSRWGLIWRTDDRECPIREAPIAIKCAFLEQAEAFFVAYFETATGFSNRAEVSIQKGVAALENTMKLGKNSAGDPR